MSARKVGLVGFYGHGNFGDDLTAVIFGRFLQGEGIPLKVFRLCSKYSNHFGFEVAKTAEELLDGIDVLLWGGGGLLVSWSDLLYRALYPRVAEGYLNLIDQAAGRGIRLMAASVGGTGSSSSRIRPLYKQRFIESACHITVRNPQDLDLLERLRVPGAYFPDIVWQTAGLFPVQPQKARMLRIGIDVYATNLLRHNGAYLVPLLRYAMKKRNDCEFVLLDTTNRTMKPYRGLGLAVRGSNCIRYQFEELERDLELLASLDLLVSSRLHAPAVCLQYGVPVISVFGEQKTRLLFRNLGLGGHYYSHAKVGALMSLLLDRERLRQYLDGYWFPDVLSLRRDSEGHLQALRAQLSNAPMK